MKWDLEWIDEDLLERHEPKVYEKLKEYRRLQYRIKQHSSTITKLKQQLSDKRDIVRQLKVQETQLFNDLQTLSEGWDFSFRIYHQNRKTKKGIVKDYKLDIKGLGVNRERNKREVVLGQEKDIISRLNTIYKGNTFYVSKHNGDKEKIVGNDYLKLIKKDWKEFILEKDKVLSERIYLMVKNDPNGFSKMILNKDVIYPLPKTSKK
jgi:hypothetical protein